MLRFLTSCLALSALSCGGRGASTEPRAAAPDSAPRAAATTPLRAEPAGAEPAGGAPGSLAATIVLDPLPPPPAQPLPRVELLAPTFGEVLDALGVEQQPVRVRVDGGAPALALVSLDGRRPRRVAGDAALELGDLLPEDEQIGRGAHAVLAVAIGTDGRALRSAAGAGAFALTDFFVGERARAPLESGPYRLFCLSPTGTFHGEDAERLRLELFGVGQAPRTLPFELRAPGLELRGELDPSLGYAVRGVPAGDARFTIGGAAGPRAECVATLNRAVTENGSP